jgi:DNA-directed RNA polymerase subunit RPC12/RpoP
MPTTRCSKCKAETASSTLSELSGEEAPLAVTVHDMPVLECPQGHRQFANADFPLLLLDHLLEHDAPQLPASDTKGLLFKHYHCAACGAELESAPDQKHTFRVEVALPELPAFDVELTMPVHRCPACGHEQLHSLKEVKSRTPAALAHAFKAAEIAAS